MNIYLNVHQVIETSCVVYIDDIGAYSCIYEFFKTRQSIIPYRKGKYDMHQVGIELKSIYEIRLV